MSAIKQISVTDLCKLHEQGGKLNVIDVRSEMEFEQAHAPIANLLPLDQISNIERLGLNKDEPIFLLCRSGNRSMSAARELEAIGFSDLYNVEGGMIDWIEKGLSTGKGLNKSHYLLKD